MLITNAPITRPDCNSVVMVIITNTIPVMQLTYIAWAKQALLSYKSPSSTSEVSWHLAQDMCTVWQQTIKNIKGLLISRSLSKQCSMLIHLHTQQLLFPDGSSSLCWAICNLSVKAHPFLQLLFYNFIVLSAGVLPFKCSRQCT